MPITEKVFAKYLDSPQMSDVDLFLRSSGEQRTSNFLPWQSVYAELFLWMCCGQMSLAKLCGKLSKSIHREIEGSEKPKN
jgi:undecaprenyl diphosphate synthase